MRTMLRTTTLVVVPAMLSLLTIGAAGTARAASTRSSWPAYAHAMHVDAARQAAMNARAVTPSSASRPPASMRSGSVSETATNVEPIGRDELKGGELDTQTEPDMAMDPNNADDLVGSRRAGRSTPASPRRRMAARHGCTATCPA
jgi:hypothetical protein